jgi:AhpC/TSA family/Thiol:disulfide interchange protein DsbD, N-terminal
VELEQQLPRFASRGLQVAAISYDSPEVLRDFARRRQITFPLLSDRESAVIRAFKLENPEYPPGHMAHGVPYPGTFVIDTAGLVRSRFFEKAYAERQTAGSILQSLGADPGGGDERRTDHFVARVSLSNPEAAPGQRITLAVDFSLAPGRHAYAPGAHSYRPLTFRLDSHPLVTLHDTVYPPPQPYFFAPLKETVPVFAGRFRLTRDVTLATGKPIAELAASADPTLTLTGAIDYQVCSDTLCYPPGSLPVSVTLRVKPLDRERVREELRASPKP